MSKFIRIGNRIINVQLITDAIFDPKSPENDNQPKLDVYLSDDRGSAEFDSLEAKQLWRYLNDMSLNITPLDIQDEAIAP